MNELKISTGTIVRTICLVLALVNQILSATGHSVLPIEDSQVEAIVTTGLTVITSLVGWWRNNSFTKFAIAGDAVKDELKANAKKKE